jgi:hypothetical protein
MTDHGVESRQLVPDSNGRNREIEKLGYVTSSELTPRVVRRTYLLHLSTKFKVAGCEVRAVLEMTLRGGHGNFSP